MPGLQDDLLAAGAVLLRVPCDVLWLSAAGWMRPFGTRGRTMVSVSRDLIEWGTRRRLLASSRVEVRTGGEVNGLAVEAGRVVGVDLRPRGAAPHEPAERMFADLVIDASGRRSHAPAWLEAAGYQRPAETVVDAELGYATRTYRRTGDEARAGLQGHLPAGPAAPHHPHGRALPVGGRPLDADGRRHQRRPAPHRRGRPAAFVRQGCGRRSWPTWSRSWSR